MEFADTQSMQVSDNAILVDLMKAIYGKALVISQR